MTVRSRGRAGVRAALLVLATAVVATGCGRGIADPPARTADARPVSVSTSDCGSGWKPGPAGRQRITLRNDDSLPGEVRLVGRDGTHRHQVFAEVEPFGPGTEVTIHPRLAAGRYVLQCLMEDAPLVTGPAVTVSGPGRGGPGVVPVDQSQLLGATQRYTRWVLGRLGGLVRDVRTMCTELAARDRTAARTAWVRAHLDYERLGAAYDAFGDLDGAINGLPTGLPRGVHDPRWTGFHRIERGLWGTAPDALLVRQADVLQRDVGALRHRLGSTQLDPLTLSIRAHEISENLLQTALTGADDAGSHSDLATVSAGLAGTHVVLHLLRPLLTTRFAQLGRLTRELASTRHLVDTLRATRLGHTAVRSWPRRQRERVDAALDQLCERLAPVAARLEPRRTS